MEHAERKSISILFVIQIIFDVFLYLYFPIPAVLIFCAFTTGFSTFAMIFNSKRPASTSIMFPRFFLNRISMLVFLVLFSPLAIISGILETLFINSNRYELDYFLPHLIFNLAGALICFTVILISNLVSGLKTYVETLSFRQDKTKTIILNASLLNIVLYYKNEFLLRPEHSSFSNIHIWINATWLFFAVYFALSCMTHFFQYFHVLRKEKIRLQLSIKLLWLFELPFLYFFFLGILTIKESHQFALFLVSTPVVLLLIWSFFSCFNYRVHQRRDVFMGVQAEDADIRVYFMAVNLFIYTGIICAKAHFNYIIFPLCVWAGYEISMFCKRYFTKVSLVRRTHTLLNNLSHSMKREEQTLKMKYYLYNHTREIFTFTQADTDKEQLYNLIRDNFIKNLEDTEKTYMKNRRKSFCCIQLV